MASPPAKSEPDLLVLQHEGKSYIKEKYNFKNYLVNGTEVERCKGNSSYGFYDGIVKTIQQKVSSGGERTKWILKEEWAGLPADKFPREYPPNRFEMYYDYDDDEDERALSRFYEAEFSPKMESLEDVTFEIIEVEVAPFNLPSYVKVRFPHNLAEFPELQHQFPCFISYEVVFNTVREAIRKHVKENHEHFRMDNFDNIQTLKVEQRILIPDSIQKPTTVEYYPNYNSRKKKSKVVTYTEKWVTVLQLEGNYKSNYGNSERTKDAVGSNYKECEKNLWDMVNGYIERLKPENVSVCECCNGSGVVKLKGKE